MGWLEPLKAIRPLQRRLRRKKSIFWKLLMRSCIFIFTVSATGKWCLLVVWSHWMSVWTKYHFFQPSKTVIKCILNSISALQHCKIIDKLRNYDFILFFFKILKHDFEPEDQTKLTQSSAGMRCFWRPDWKLEWPWFSQQKANEILDFWIIAESEQNQITQTEV